MVDDGPSEGGAAVDPWGALVQAARLAIASPTAVRTEAVVFVASGLTLARIGRLDGLGAAALRETCGPWLFGVFAVAGTSLFVRGLTWTFGESRRRIGESFRWRRARERMGQLSEDEKAILRPYVERRARTQDLDPHDPVVMDLAEAGLIEERAEGLFVRRRPYVLKERAWQYLHQNPRLLAPGFGDGQDEPGV